MERQSAGMAKFQQKLDGSRITFQLVEDDSLPEFGASHYLARIENAWGSTILELRLPISMVESSVVGQGIHDLMMSPDGTISVLYDGADGLVSPGIGVPVDTFVECSLSPTMLEDEPDAAKALNTLRDRLKRALLAVDIAQNQLK